MGLREILKKLLGKAEKQAPPKPPVVKELSGKDLDAVAGGQQQQQGAEEREKPDGLGRTYP
jgi:hypothetical protein